MFIYIHCYLLQIRIHKALKTYTQKTEREPEKKMPYSRERERDISLKLTERSLECACIQKFCRYRKKRINIQMKRELRFGLIMKLLEWFVEV